MEIERFRPRQEVAHRAVVPRAAACGAHSAGRNYAAGTLTQIAGAYGSPRGAKKTIEDQIGSVNYEVEADQVFAVAKGASIFRIHCVRLD
jgi:hypothetical protein